jgi:hypothetical protein
MTRCTPGARVGSSTTGSCPDLEDGDADCPATDPIDQGHDPVNLIDLQRRQPGPRADELLAGVQAAVAADEHVRWNESGHARLRVGQALEDARASRWRPAWPSSGTIGETTSRSCSSVPRRRFGPRPVVRPVGPPYRLTYSARGATGCSRSPALVRSERSAGGGGHLSHTLGAGVTASAPAEGMQVTATTGSPERSVDIWTSGGSWSLPTRPRRAASRAGSCARRRRGGGYRPLKRRAARRARSSAASRRARISCTRW